MQKNARRHKRIPVFPALLALVLSFLVVGAPAQMASATTFDNSAITKVVTGADHTCAIKSGEVFCWGRNNFGQLGDGTTTSRANPTAVVNGTAGFSNTSVTDIAVGDGATCAIKGGEVFCWGKNDWKQLGVNSAGTSCASIDCSATPVKVSAGDTTNSGFSLVAISTWHACGVKGGVAYCWGGSGSGRLGINDASLSASCSSQKCTHEMKQVSNNGSDFTNAGITAISAGSSFTCVLRTAQMNCWGGNHQKQLGNLSAGSSSHLPLKPDTGGQFDSSTVSSISTGFTHTCAVSSNKVFCWGSNGMGQSTGTVNVSDSATPAALAADGAFTNTAVQEVQAGYHHTCAREASIVFCWGSNTQGKLGTGDTSATTARVKVVDGDMVNSGISSIAVGSTAMHSCAIKQSTSKVYCWGSTTDGRIGAGNIFSATSPKLVTPPSSSSNNSNNSSNNNSTPTSVPGVTATAVLKDSKVVVTISNLPATSLSSVTITVAPQSFDLSIPRFGSSYTDYVGEQLSGGTLPTVTNNGFAVTVDNMKKKTITNGVPGPIETENFAADGSYHVKYAVNGSANSTYPTGWLAFNSQSPSTLVKVTAASTTSGGGSSSDTSASYANATPGVTITDTTVYTTAPVKVAANSAINVLTPAQAKTLDVETKTPAVCLPNDDELVFLDEGRCIAEVVNTKTRKVLRTLRTTVVEDDIAELKVGNEIVTLAPIYFEAMSASLDTKAMGRLRSLKARVSAAGSVLVIGHSGTLNGNSPANVAISRARAQATVAALRSIGAKGPFAVSGVGALDPVRSGSTETAQAKNRRVVIALIP